jgi:hydroxyethylthiazole kinase
MFEKMQTCVEHIRQNKPLVLNLTNYVTMDLMANSLLALGAAPIMSEEAEELAELIAIAHSININIGTLHGAFLKNMRLACSEAKVAGKPIVLDPVGVGATKIRHTAAKECLPYASIVRGNASEVMALQTDLSCSPLGVESTNASQEALEAGFKISKQYQCVIAISGATDFIIGLQNAVSLPFGSSLMTNVTGMGCTLSAVVAAFHAVESDAFLAAKLGTAYIGLCGEQAALKASTPGAFRTTFIDCLYAPQWGFFQDRIGAMHAT